MHRGYSYIVCSIFVYIALICPTFAAEKSDRSTIEVVGTAKIMVMPNLATISFAVETNAENAEQAVKENGKRTGKLLNSLKRIAGEESKITTSGFSLSAIYKKEKRLHPRGYRVTNAVLLTTKDTDKLGILIDEASKVGVGRIGSLMFSTDKEDQFRREAAVKAVDQAMQIAKDLAKAANLNIKKIIKLSYAPMGPLRPYRMEAMAAARTPIEIGEIPIEERVTVVFAVD
jgi:uncharacterized protein YggE